MQKITYELFVQKFGFEKNIFDYFENIRLVKIFTLNLSNLTTKTLNNSIVTISYQTLV